MKTNLVRAAFACAAVAFTGTAAFATVTPISSTPIVLEHDPVGIAAKATTDANGNVTFGDLKPGRYALFIEESLYRGTISARVSCPPCGWTVPIAASVPSARGKTYLRDAAGNKLILTIPGGISGRAPRGGISVNLSKLDR